MLKGEIINQESNMRYIIDEPSKQVLIIGSPEEIVRFYDEFLRTDLARIQKGIVPSSYSFPEGTKPSYDSLEEITYGLNIDESFNYALYRNPKPIGILRGYRPSKEAISEFDQRLNKESKVGGWRIEYENYSYIRVYSRLSPPYIIEKTQDEVVEKTRKKLDMAEGEVAIEFSSTDKIEFENIYWSLKEVTNFNNIMNGFYISGLDKRI